MGVHGGTTLSRYMGALRCLGPGDYRIQNEYGLTLFLAAALLCTASAEVLYRALIQAYGITLQHCTMLAYWTSMPHVTLCQHAVLTVLLYCGVSIQGCTVL